MEGIESTHAYATLSLDATDDNDDGPPAMLATLGVEDANSSTSRSASRSSRCSRGSAQREKRILLLRFFKNMTQSQIAEEIGVSQMHVSRLLTRTLAQLRTSLEATEPRARPRPPPERLGGRRVQQPGDHHHGHDRQPDRQQRGRRRGSSTPVPAGSAGPSRPGPRAQRRAFHSDQAHHASPAAAARKNTVVVTPMVSRTERRLASSRTASTTSTNASRATRAAATRSGGGATGSGPRGISLRRNGHCTTVVVTDTTSVGGCVNVQRLQVWSLRWILAPGPS